MEQISFKRQVLLFNPDNFKAISVAIIGLGNIGSHTALTLARLGIQNFFLYDPDVVEPHNVASQNYSLDEVGKNKVQAIDSKIRAINKEALVIANYRKWRPSTNLPNVVDIVIIAVDNMKERKMLHKLCKDIFPAKHLIDARIGGNQIEIYNCKTLKEWAQTFTDNPSDDPCGGRYISYVSVIIGGVIANQIKKILKGEPVNKSLMVDANSLDVIKDFSW